MNTEMTSREAIVIGSGPNGLAAAIRLAQAGQKVLVIEGHPLAGGGTRTTELTEPGFHHDVCSAIHPMGMASPFLKTLPLEKFGLEWIQPEIPLAHPFDDGSCASLFRSLGTTAAQFDGSSEAAYRRVFEPLVPHADSLLDAFMGPPRFPGNPIAVAQFGMRALPAALDAARLWFDDERARAFLAGNAAHSVMPLDRPLATNAIGLMLMMMGHAYGWPIAKGGSRSITAAMIAYLESLGGEIETGRPVTNLDELPPASSYIFDTSPSAMSAIAGSRLPDTYRKKLGRYRHGPGIFKIDYALSEPVPWLADDCRKAGTVHLGGTLDEIVVSEREAWEGIHSERPFVLAAQQSLFDPSRAPRGKETFWAYCHVPAGSTVDMTSAIGSQIERFAPGFQDCVIAKHTMSSDDFERYNPNFIGGDIVGGVADWRQLLTRPVVSARPHRTPASDIFICSAATPPGAGVHGMGGYRAAGEVLKK